MARSASGVQAVAYLAEALRDESESRGFGLREGLSTRKDDNLTAICEQIR
jgi:hypothetical protein